MVKNKLRDLIIWLFEKYAYDYWVEKQYQQERTRIKKEYNLSNDKEIDEFLAERDREPLREAYEAGARDTYERIMKRGEL